jgi:hypothetical protein
MDLLYGRGEHGFFAEMIKLSREQLDNVLVRGSSQSEDELRLLEIETARVRHAWAKTQVKNGGATPALLKRLKESLEELSLLKIERAEGNGEDSK